VGVRPEVNIAPAEGLISFQNVLVGETAERAFTITNVSNFPVNFTLLSQVEGVGNLSTVRPFNLVPS
jgi:hypothetical protein